MSLKKETSTSAHTQTFLKYVHTDNHLITELVQDDSGFAFDLYISYCMTKGNIRV